MKKQVLFLIFMLSTISTSILSVQQNTGKNALTDMKDFFSQVNSKFKNSNEGIERLGESMSSGMLSLCNVSEKDCISQVKGCLSSTNPIVMPYCTHAVKTKNFWSLNNNKYRAPVYNKILEACLNGNKESLTTLNACNAMVNFKMNPSTLKNVTSGLIKIYYALCKQNPYKNSNFCFLTYQNNTNEKMNPIVFQSACKYFPFAYQSYGGLSNQCKHACENSNYTDSQACSAACTVAIRNTEENFKSVINQSTACKKMYNPKLAPKLNFNIMSCSAQKYSTNKACYPIQECRKGLSPKQADEYCGKA